MSKALVTGTPWRAILFFAIPLLLGNIVQQMYQVVDAVVVGQHLGVNALASVGTTGGILFFLMGFSWGMTTGFAIPTAQAVGAMDEAGVRRSVAAGTVLTAAMSVVLTAAAPFLARPFLELLRTPPELLDDAVVFATVNFAGASAIMFFNYLSAIIRAMGDSRTPLVFLAIACGINMALVVLFVGVLGMGVGGAALATVVAQLLSVIFCLIYIHLSIPLLHVRREDWGAGMRELGSHLAIGLPMGFQSSIIAIGALAVQVRLNSLGAEAVAAYTTATRVDGLANAFLASLGLAVSTFVAQNYGAKQYDRIHKGVREGIAMAVGASVILAGILISAGNPIVRLFVGSGENEVVSMAHEFLVVNGLLYSVLGVLFVTRGALQGIGNATIPLLSGLLELVMRVAAAVILGGAFGFTGIIWASPLAWVGAAIILVPAWTIASRTLRASVDKMPAASIPSAVAA